MDKRNSRWRIKSLTVINEYGDTMDLSYSDYASAPLLFTDVDGGLYESVGRAQGEAIDTGGGCDNTTESDEEYKDLEDIDDRDEYSRYWYPASSTLPKEDGLYNTVQFWEFNDVDKCIFGKEGRKVHQVSYYVSSLKMFGNVVDPPAGRGIKGLCLQFVGNDVPLRWEWPPIRNADLKIK